ncbi:MAG: 1-acyl-sn-glycerol-3-phosphate acyltransferase [Deltaproteobacteria bacterium]|nr:1-acyl-sn-glycerol-3-phosphate acyltransferase [Deltaproteobacteria bacterium]
MADENSGLPGVAASSGAKPPSKSWLWTGVTWVLVVVFLTVGAVLCVAVGGTAALLGDRQRRVAHQMLRFGYGCVVRLHPRYRLRMTGLENLPAGPAVLCPNHQSHSDVVFLYALPLFFKWVIKKELGRVPLFGISMRVARYPIVDRGDPQSAMQLMQEVAAALVAGVPVLTFPEGTRSTSSELGRFQSGGARMAIASQVPLVPIGVAGTGTLLPRGSAWFSDQRRVGIHVGRPIPTAGRTVHEVRALTRELRAAVLEARQRATALLER